MKKKKLSIYSKAALAISILALIIAIINIFLQIENLRWTVILLVFLVFVLNIWDILKEYLKVLNENEMLQYELGELQYSYKQMGKYIAKFDIPELHDIDLRIENELNDIEVRKSLYAEIHGIQEN